ncbi:Ser/Thr protein kinase RdoA involved in Cpx stress response, MazF antagonist [Halovenus aranensis]|uniref:Ser/Thr protein kinase RdoA involved in Cpx stress response, MazF antagonist n=1 Tax=Halovenus aranensis TaxID=890420 RepID=A0A1G8VT70_9EURY|nr:phosphotransferase [Halovenus aranensis]SDJ69244.1 Ser/Thr protein kinase RdoA involved in Cpx stress response, MazF antagonist [Halovenus aranensis]
MREKTRDRLEAQFESYSIDDRLHDVPPHAVYEVTVEGRRAVAKLDTDRTGSAGMAGAVIGFVGARTSVPVPEVLARGNDYYVTAWHPEAPTPEADQVSTEEWARTAGRGMATLHAETASHLDGYGQFEPAGSNAIETTGHDEWHAAAIEYVTEYRPTLERHGHGDIAQRALDCLRAHPDAFAGTGTSVCCHGWVTPEHLAVRDGEPACLVDFEHAIGAPGEFDYWRTVLPTFGPEDDGTRAAFRRGYESVRPLPDGLATRRPWYVLLHLLYFFESLYVQDQHDPETTEQKAADLRTTVTEILADCT